MSFIERYFKNNFMYKKYFTQCFYCLSFVFFTLLFGCKENQTKEDLTGENFFDYGKIENGIYQNEQFNFKLEFPEDWDIMGAKRLHRHILANNPNYLNETKIKNIDTASLFVLYPTKDGKHIADYSSIKNIIPSLDSLMLEIYPNHNPEEFYKKIDSTKIAWVRLYFNFENISYLPKDSQNPKSYIEGLLKMMKGEGDDSVSNVLALMSHHRDKVEFSEVYTLEDLVKNKTLYGFDIINGKSINNTAIAFEKDGFIWLFQLLYSNETQKQMFMDVISTLSFENSENDDPQSL